MERAETKGLLKASSALPIAAVLIGLGLSLLATETPKGAFLICFFLPLFIGQALVDRGEPERRELWWLAIGASVLAILGSWVTLTALGPHSHWSNPVRLLWPVILAAAYLWGYARRVGGRGPIGRSMFVLMGGMFFAVVADKLLTVSFWLPVAQDWTTAAGVFLVSLAFGLILGGLPSSHQRQSV